MILSGGRQRLCFGAWVLAALILAAVNGFGFLSMQGQALGGYSPSIKALQLKLARLENASAVRSAVEFSRNEVQLLFAAYRRSHLAAIGGGAASADAAGPSASPEDPALPPLTGIMQVADGSGAYYFTAVLGGRICREKDRVMDFVVAEISPRGVSLSRSARRWFIQSPMVKHSIDRGE